MDDRRVLWIRIRLLTVDFVFLLVDVVFISTVIGKMDGEIICIVIQTKLLCSFSHMFGR